MNQQDLWSWTTCNSPNFTFFIVKAETKIESSHPYVKHFSETWHNMYLLFSKFITFECSLNIPWPCLRDSGHSICWKQDTFSHFQSRCVCTQTWEHPNRQSSAHLCLLDWVWSIWKLNIIISLCHLVFWVVCCRYLEIFCQFYWHIGSQVCAQFLPVPWDKLLHLIYLYMYT